MDQKETAVIPTDNVDVLQCTVGFRVDCNTLDRENDRFRDGSLDLTNHMKIPVALFSHDRNLPVGTTDTPDGSYTLTYKGNVVEGSIRFNQNSFDAMSAFDLAYHRILRGVSLGFLPGKTEPNEFGGVDYLSAELVEVSLCILPENPDGLVTWVTKALKGKPLELSEPILRHLHKHYPAEKVSMILTTKSVNPVKKSDDKPADEKKPEETKPADKKPDEEKPVDLPPGAKALTEAYDMKAALALKFAEMSKTLEPGTAAKEHFDAMCQALNDMVEDTKACYGKAYPDAPEFKADSGAEHEIPTEQVKSLRELEQGFKSVIAENKSLRTELDRMKRNTGRKIA